MMHGHEKSDSVIVAAKLANKAAHPVRGSNPRSGQPRRSLVEPRAENEGKMLDQTKHVSGRRAG